MGHGFLSHWLTGKKRRKTARSAEVTAGQHALNSCQAHWFYFDTEKMVTSLIHPRGKRFITGSLWLNNSDTHTYEMGFMEPLKSQKHFMPTNEEDSLAFNLVTCFFTVTSVWLESLLFLSLVTNVFPNIYPPSSLALEQYFTTLMVQ